MALCIKEISSCFLNIAEVLKFLWLSTSRLASLLLKDLQMSRSTSEKWSCFSQFAICIIPRTLYLSIIGTYIAFSIFTSYPCLIISPSISWLNCLSFFWFCLTIPSFNYIHCPIKLFPTALISSLFIWLLSECISNSSSSSSSLKD